MQVSVECWEVSVNAKEGHPTQTVCVGVQADSQGKLRICGITGSSKIK